jgi:hypothetical protein
MDPEKNEKETVHYEEVDIKHPEARSMRDVLPDWGKPWYKIGHLNRLNLLLLPVILSGIYNGWVPFSIKPVRLY